MPKSDPTRIGGPGNASCSKSLHSLLIFGDSSNRIANGTVIVSSTRIQNPLSRSHPIANYYVLQISDKYLSPSAFALSGTAMDENHRPAEFKPELNLKPVIKELARTQVCFPNVKLLVDRISIVTLPATKESTETKAFRLYLTDGDWNIQGNLSLAVGHFSSRLMKLLCSCAQAGVPQSCHKLRCPRRILRDLNFLSSFKREEVVWSWECHIYHN